MALKRSHETGCKQLVFDRFNFLLLFLFCSFPNRNEKKDLELFNENVRLLNPTENKVLLFCLYVSKFKAADLKQIPKQSVVCDSTKLIGQGSLWVKESKPGLFFDLDMFRLHHG